jgi:hypothetical protein
MVRGTCVHGSRVGLRRGSVTAVAALKRLTSATDKPRPHTVTPMKGPPVNSTEHTAKTRSPETGLFGTLRAFLGVRGSDAPSSTATVNRITHSRANHSASSHHAVAQAAIKKTTGLIKNPKLKVLGFMPIMAMLLTPTVFVSSALATRGHVFASAFGNEGSGNGEFKGPSGVAVNEATGDVYVVDKGSNRHLPAGTSIGANRGR